MDDGEPNKRIKVEGLGPRVVGDGSVAAPPPSVFVRPGELGPPQLPAGGGAPPGGGVAVAHMEEFVTNAAKTIEVPPVSSEGTASPR